MSNTKPKFFLYWYQFLSTVDKIWTNWSNKYIAYKWLSRWIVLYNQFESSPSWICLITSRICSISAESPFIMDLGSMKPLQKQPHFIEFNICNINIFVTVILTTYFNKFLSVFCRGLSNVKTIKANHSIYINPWFAYTQIFI